MRKSDKKLDKQLRQWLTDICENNLKQVDGFQWLTHVVNYSNFPQSLKVVCVFDDNKHLEQYQQTNTCSQWLNELQTKLLANGIKINNISKHVLLDSEENCSKQNNGNWANRLA